MLIALQDCEASTNATLGNLSEAWSGDVCGESLF